MSSIPFSGKESLTATNPDSSSFVKMLSGQIWYSEKHTLYRLLRDMNAQVISIILDKTYRYLRYIHCYSATSSERVTGPVTFFAEVSLGMFNSFSFGRASFPLNSEFQK